MHLICPIKISDSTYTKLNLSYLHLNLLSPHFLYFNATVICPVPQTRNLKSQTIPLSFLHSGLNKYLANIPLHAGLQSIPSPSTWSHHYTVFQILVSCLHHNNQPPIYFPSSSSLITSPRLSERPYLKHKDVSSMAPHSC